MEDLPVAIATAVLLLGEHLAPAEEEDAQISLDRTMMISKGKTMPHKSGMGRLTSNSPNLHWRRLSLCLFFAHILVGTDQNRSTLSVAVQFRIR